jgi:acyl-coenzyme A thioesterase PaaI-like protein
MADDERRRFRPRWEAADHTGGGLWQIRRRLADAMRLVIERLTVSDAPEAELEEAARRLEEYAQHLETHPRRDRYDGFGETAVADPEEQEGGGHFDWSPLIGLSNPLAPPILLESRDERVFAQVTFGSAYEGAPGCVHGGCVAAAFDEILGYAQTFSGQPGMTGTLTTIYRSPTPIHTPLVFEAWIERVEGRKVTCRGTLHAGERLCAEANAIFVSLRPGRYDDLVRERATRKAPGSA